MLFLSSESQWGASEAGDMLERSKDNSFGSQCKLLASLFCFLLSCFFAPLSLMTFFVLFYFPFFLQECFTAATGPIPQVTQHALIALSASLCDCETHQCLCSDGFWKIKDEIKRACLLDPLWFLQPSVLISCLLSREPTYPSRPPTYPTLPYPTPPCPAAQTCRTLMFRSPRLSSVRVWVKRHFGITFAERPALSASSSQPSHKLHIHALATS